MLFKTLDANVPAGITQNNYDLNGNLAKIIDANGNATNYTYDGFDRPITQTFANATGHAYFYDKNDNIIVNTLPDTHTIVYDYDNLNRLTAKHYPQNTLGIDATFTYDLGSRLLTANNAASNITLTYDSLNRVTAETQQLPSILTPLTVGYGYDASGNRTLVNYPIGFGINIGFDGGDRLQTIGLGGFNFINYTYDTLNRPVQRNVTGAVTLRADHSYDIADQVLNVTNSLVGVAGVARDYTYDMVGNRTNKAESIPGLLPPVSTGYNYNTIDELTNVTGVQGLLNPVSAAHSFSYDKVANRTNVDGYTVTSNNVNQYVSAGPIVPTYDLNGNTTFNGLNTLTYDDENRLKSAQNPIHTSQYTFDAFDRRVSKTVDGVTTYYVYSGNQILEEHDGAGNFKKSFLYGLSIDEVLFEYNPSSGVGSGFYVLMHDALGSVTEIFDFITGAPVEYYTYDVYGTPTINGNPAQTQSAIGNPFLFTGMQWDTEAFTYQYRARQYDPTIGRFLQRDPLGYWDGMNLYRYVYNNPINYTDPYGFGYFYKKQLKGYPWIPGISSNSYLDKMNQEFSHEQYFYDNGTNTGYGPTGPFNNENVKNYTEKNPTYYDDETMKEAQSHVEPHWKGDAYCVSSLDSTCGKTNNCQSYADALKDEYERIKNAKNKK